MKPTDEQLDAMLRELGSAWRGRTRIEERVDPAWFADNSSMPRFARVSGVIAAVAAFAVLTATLGALWLTNVPHQADSTLGGAASAGTGATGPTSSAQHTPGSQTSSPSPMNASQSPTQSLSTETPSPTASTDWSSAPELPIWTAESIPSACPTAIDGGRLARHPNSGLGFTYAYGVRAVIWPFRFTARLAEGGQAVLINRAGHAIAIEGDKLVLGGGVDPDGAWRVCGLIEVERQR